MNIFKNRDIAGLVFSNVLLARTRFVRYDPKFHIPVPELETSPRRRKISVARVRSQESLQKKLTFFEAIEFAVGMIESKYPFFKPLQHFSGHIWTIFCNKLTYGLYDIPMRIFWFDSAWPVVHVKASEILRQVVWISFYRLYLALFDHIHGKFVIDI